MGILDFFRKISQMTPEDARNLLKKTAPGSVQVIDVRSEKEYEKGHLPGARNIPVDQLEERQRELDPEATTLIY
jgi:rhodanese-related sulfurtransferase